MAIKDELEAVPQDSQQWVAVKAEFYNAQAAQCAICRRGMSFDEAQLDHCHETGFIRGVLCVSCNTKLGFYETRRAAIERYLATAAEFAAYIVPTQLPRQPKTKADKNERWRRYWQSKELD